MYENKFFPNSGEQFEGQHVTVWQAARKLAAEEGYDHEEVDAPPSPLPGEDEKSYLLVRASRQRLMEEAERIGMMVDIIDSIAEAEEDDKQVPWSPQQPSF